MFSAGKSFALPFCKGSPTASRSTPDSWTDCFGIYSINSGKHEGNKYVGEFEDGKKHGYGTYTHADGRVEEGIWENDKFLYAQKLA